MSKCSSGILIWNENYFIEYLGITQHEQIFIALIGKMKCLEIHNWVNKLKFVWISRIQDMLWGPCVYYKELFSNQTCQSKW